MITVKAVPFSDYQSTDFSREPCDGLIDDLSLGNVEKKRGSVQVFFSPINLSKMVNPFGTYKHLLDIEEWKSMCSTHGQFSGLVCLHVPACNVYLDIPEGDL